MNPGPAGAASGASMSNAADSAGSSARDLRMSEIKAGDPVFRARSAVANRRHRRVPVDVASTGAVPQFAGGVVRTGAADLAMFARLVVAGMAARAVRLERGVTPVHGLGVVLVTPGAGEIAAMVQWLVAETRVSKGVR